MNKHGWLLLGLLASAPVLAVDDPAVPPADQAGAVATAATEAPGSESWRIGYTLGNSLGQRMVGDLPDLDIDAFNEGFLDAYQHKPGKLLPDQMQAAFERFQEQRIARLQEAHSKMLTDNLAKAEAFLAGNGKRKGVKKTKSGLQYEVLAKGKGKSPAAHDIVIAHYRGTLVDGTEFDTTAGGDPAEFPLDRVITGWQEGVRLMNRGAKYRFYLPPQLAYGADGIGEGDVIGPNQVLVFEIELLDFHAPEPAELPAEKPAREPAPFAEPL